MCRVWLANLLLGLVFGSATGCLSSPVEEVEHHAPAHRPATFVEAVARLPQLHDELVAESQRAPDTLSALDELRDIVRWLPELAADSDLKEAAWNQVRRHSRELATRLASLDREAYLREAAACADVWRELAEIADTLGRAN